MLRTMQIAGKSADAALVAGQEGKVHHPQQVFRSFVSWQIDLAAGASRYECCCSLDPCQDLMGVSASVIRAIVSACVMWTNVTTIQSQCTTSTVSFCKHSHHVDHRTELWFLHALPCTMSQTLWRQCLVFSPLECYSNAHPSSKGSIGSPCSPEIISQRQA